MFLAVGLLGVWLQKNGDCIQISVTQKAPIPPMLNLIENIKFICAARILLLESNLLLLGVVV